MSWRSLLGYAPVPPPSTLSADQRRAHLARPTSSGALAGYSGHPYGYRAARTPAGQQVMAAMDRQSARTAASPQPRYGGSPALASTRLGSVGPTAPAQPQGGWDWLSALGGLLVGGGDDRDARDTTRWGQ